MRKQPRARGTKAKYRVDAFYDIKEKASQDIKKEKLELDIKESRQGGKILEVEHISKKYGEQKIVDDFSYVFKKKDRIGVVGKNGIGKSTFLDMLTGKLKPDSGEITPGVTTKYGYFTQETITLNPANRVIEEVKAIAEFITLADGSQLSASKFLETFLFSADKQYNYIDKLSGGEKKRLQLLKLLITNPNFLILDEPTNDFDIDTLNVLEDFLDKFGGCLLLVSHDRYFMDHLVDQLFVFEGEGKIRLFNGNYSDYRIWAEEQEQADAKPQPVKEVTTTSTQKNTISYKEKQEHGKLQQEIEKLEAEKDKLNAILNAPTSDAALLIETGKKIEQLNAEIDAKTARWFELDALIE